MTTAPPMTPIDWIKFVHRLPLDETGTKLDRVTRKACHGQANVASICLLGLTAFSEPATLAQVKKVVSYELSPSSFDGLVTAGLVNQVPGKYRSWKLNAQGLEVAAQIHTSLEALIAKLTQTPTDNKP